MIYLFSDDGTFSGYYRSKYRRVFVLESLNMCLDEGEVQDAVRGATPSRIGGFRVLRVFPESVIRELAATVYSESYHNSQESEGIARVIRNRAEHVGVDYGSPNFWLSHSQGGIGGSGIYGRRSSRFRQANSTPIEKWLDNNAMLTDLEATVRALFSKSDITNGAYFWEGNASLNNPNNYFRVRLNQNPPVFVITRVLGRTTFMRYNPEHPTFGRNVWP